MEFLAIQNNTFLGFELAKYTGSVHVVITDRKIVTATNEITAEIVEVNDFYAWGQ